MNFCAFVPLDQLEQVMSANQPDHFAWGRSCEPSHDHARRTPSLVPFVDDEEDLPKSCLLCRVIEHEVENRRQRASQAIGQFIAASNETGVYSGPNDAGSYYSLFYSTARITFRNPAKSTTVIFK